MTVSALNTCNCPLLQVGKHLCRHRNKDWRCSDLQLLSIRSWIWVLWQTLRTPQSTSYFLHQGTRGQVWWILLLYIFLFNCFFTFLLFVWKLSPIFKLAGLMDKKSRLKQLRKLSLKNTEVSDVSLRYITQYLPQVNSFKWNSKSKITAKTAGRMWGMWKNFQDLQSNGVHKTQNMVKLKPCSASFAVAAALSWLPTTLACSGAASVCPDNLVTTWWLVVPQSNQKYLKVPRNTSKYP